MSFLLDASKRMPQAVKLLHNAKTVRIPATVGGAHKN
jgi:hypothetical protein